MRCVVCRRLLSFATVAIPGPEGPRVWGPTCAKRAGLIEPKRKRAPQLFRRASWEAFGPPREVDPRQQDLFGATS